MEHVYRLNCDLSVQSEFILQVCEQNQVNTIKINSIQYHAFEFIDSLCCLSVNVLPSNKFCFPLISSGNSSALFPCVHQIHQIQLRSNFLLFSITNVDGEPFRANCLLSLYVSLL